MKRLTLSNPPVKVTEVVGQDLPDSPTLNGVLRLFHQLNNQLGIILANAELLENRLPDEAHRLRAGQVVSSALDAIETVRKLRVASDVAKAS
jgi:hypothetical protein